MKGLKTTAALALILVSARARAQGTLCAVVKLEILQTATFEREAFDAHLAISNNLPTTPLTNLKVQLFFTDPDGNSAGSLFFVKTSTLTNVNAVDGTGVVQSSTTAGIDWLIIPSTGAGGSLPAGIQYSVTAAITALSGGSPQNVTTFPAAITVQPQPLINLEYALPFEVFGQEPLISQITPIVPYPVALRVTNVGYGTAPDFQVQSAQPLILDNKQGLAVAFNIIGTDVGGQTIPNTLLIPFGDLAPGQVSQAAWVMTSSLSGRFISFTSTFTHAASLGGQLTSLIQSATTYTLLSTVLVDLPVPDQTPDMLVNETTDRGTMQTMLDSGTQPPAQYILEADQPSPLPVTEISGAISGALSGANAALTFTLTSAVGPNVWVHSYAPFSYGDTVTLTSAQRADGKVINPANVWISKHFNTTTLAYMYWLNILDLTSSTNTYTVQFNPAQLVTAPAAVSNLSAATGANGGDVALTWTAPGEGGDTGYLFGGRYFIEAAIDSTTVFSPDDAQLTITTNASPGDAQEFDATGLVGNATNYFRLWTQNGGGAMSALSNGATAYALPNPPQNLQLADVTSTSAYASWTIGDNSIPIDYQLFVATAAGGVVLSSTPFLDSFTSTYTFGGLPSDTSLQFFGFGENPDTLVAGPTVFLGSTVTAPAAPLPLAFTSASSFSVTANWGANGNPPTTQYRAELSTSPSHAPLFQASLTSSSTSFLFAGLATCTTYYGQVRSLGSGGAWSADADLGPALTLSPASTYCGGVPSWYVIASTGLNAYGLLTQAVDGTLVLTATTTATSALQYISHGSSTYWLTEDSSDGVMRLAAVSTTTVYGDLYLLDASARTWQLSIDADGVLRTTGE